MKHIRLFILGLVLILGTAASAQESGWIRVNLQDKLTINLPIDWSISDKNQRQAISEWAKKLINNSEIHTTSLSAASYPQPSNAFVRVSFLTLDQPLSQIEVIRMLKLERKTTMEGLAEMWSSESPQLWNSLAKVGIREVGHPSFSNELIGGKMALTISYARTSSTISSGVMDVTQYHIPNGSEKVLITISKIRGDKNAENSTHNIMNSIAIN